MLALRLRPSVLIRVDKQHIFHLWSSPKQSIGGGVNRHCLQIKITHMPVDAFAAVEAVYRSDWGRIVATLIGLLGDFELAEEYAQEAFAAALDHWSISGVPESPRAWIVQTARHKAIDRIRRQKLFQEKLQPQLAYDTESTVHQPELADGEIPDERLRLIFTCCHPALAREA